MALSAWRESAGGPSSSSCACPSFPSCGAQRAPITKAAGSMRNQIDCRSLGSCDIAVTFPLASESNQCSKLAWIQATESCRAVWRAQHLDNPAPLRIFVRVVPAQQHLQRVTTGRGGGCTGSAGQAPDQHESEYQTELRASLLHSHAPSFSGSVTQGAKMRTA